MRAVLWIALAGCGRLGFEPFVSRGDAPPAETIGPVDTVASDALVAWYPMDALTQNGTVDATGHGHDATCNAACPMPVPGRLGNALAFDGTTRLDVPSDAALMTSRGFTIAAWLQIPGIPADRACAATKGLGTGIFNSWALCIETNQTVFFYTVKGMTVDNLFSTATVSAAAWHHVAVRWDGTTKTISLDAIDVGSDAATTEFDGQPIHIGQDVDNGNVAAPYVGLIDDLRIYDRALTSQELAQLAR